MSPSRSALSCGVVQVTRCAVCLLPVKGHSHPTGSTLRLRRACSVQQQLHFLTTDVLFPGAGLVQGIIFPQPCGGVGPKGAAGWERPIPFSASPDSPEVAGFLEFF